jgi:hypothetical protein
MVGDLGGRGIISEPLQRDRIPGAVPREPERKRPVVLGDPDAIMDVEPRVRPLEHRLGLVGLKELPPHEEPEHRAPERLGEPPGVVRRPMHEGPIEAKAAVDDDHMDVRVARAMERRISQLRAHRRSGPQIADTLGRPLSTVGDV